MKVRTVTVNRGGVPVRINESRFDPDRDKLWQEKAKPEKKPEGDSVKVVDQGRGWFTVEVGGVTVTDKNVRKAEAEEIAAEHR